MPDVTSQPKTRIERDSLGTLEVPADAYYGVQTARAVVNFPISGERLHVERRGAHQDRRRPRQHGRRGSGPEER